MRTLFLHIGHGKTGTSYLQSCFALSGEALASARITYPKAKNEEDAAAGRITSGNGRFLAADLETSGKSRSTATALKAYQGDVLYSSEFFFHHLAKLNTPDNLLAFADAAGIDKVRIFLAIRDPLDHIRSAYLQNVQRGGETGHIDDMAKRFNMPMRVSQLIRRHKHPRIHFTIRNYSRMRAKVVAETAAWLNIPAEALTRPPQPTVNRSLTFAECEIQRSLNARFGPCGYMFADRVVEALPGLTPYYPTMSNAARQITHDRCLNAMMHVNRQVDAEQAYAFDLDPTGVEDVADDDTVTISRAEIDNIVAALKGRLRR